MPWLPGVLFGALSIGGSVLILFLPETLNRPLPQTIEDIENWSRKKHARHKDPQDEAGSQEMSPSQTKPHDDAAAAADGHVSVDGSVPLAPANGGNSV